MFNAVVFDLDGTLIDSDEAIVLALKKLFKLHGYPVPSRATVLKYSGYSVENWVTAVLYAQGVKGDVASLSKETLVYVRDYFEKTGNLVPTAVETLAALRKRGLLVALISNTSHFNLHTILRELKLEQFFDETISSTEMHAPKPYPDSMLDFLKRHKLAKSECLYVGDSDVDLHFARNSGVKLALLSRPRNKTVKRDYSLRKLSGLLDIVNK